MTGDSEIQMNIRENSCEKQLLWPVFAVGEAFFQITGAPM